MGVLLILLPSVADFSVLVVAFPVLTDSLRLAHRTFVPFLRGLLCAGLFLGNRCFE